MARQRTNPFAHVNKNSLSAEQIVENKDSEHITTEANLDSYLEIAEKEDAIETAEKDLEIDDLKKKIEELNSKISEIMAYNARLINENENLKKKISDNKEYNDLVVRCDNLKTENERLSLAMSEISMKNSVLNASIKSMQNEIDGMKRVCEPQRYQNAKTQNGNAYFKKSMNGYQEWC